MVLCVSILRNAISFKEKKISFYLKSLIWMKSDKKIHLCKKFYIKYFKIDKNELNYIVT